MKLKRDTDATAREKRFEDVWATFVANRESLKLVHPAQDSSRHVRRPSEEYRGRGHGQCYGRRCVFVWLAQEVITMGLGVSAVGISTKGRRLGRPGFSFDGRNRIHQGKQIPPVVAIGPGDGECQRNPLTIREHVMFVVSSLCRSVGLGPVFSRRKLRINRYCLLHMISRVGRTEQPGDVYFARSLPGTFDVRKRKASRVYHLQQQSKSWGNNSHGITVRVAIKAPNQYVEAGQRGAYVPSYIASCSFRVRFALYSIMDKHEYGVEL